MRMSHVLMAAVACVLTASLMGQSAPPAAGPYKVIKKEAAGGTGGMDYVFADDAGRKLYVPRGNRVEVFDLDTLKPAGTISPTNGVHGAAVDPVSKHGFCSSNPVVMWDTETLKTIKTIPVTGGPDGILFDPFTQHVHILSHSAPNVTVIDTKDGAVLGTIDLGGPPEQGVSDGKGKLYITIEQVPGKVAVVDAKTMKVLTTYDLGAKGGQLAGMAMDVKNNILFVSGRTPAACVVMNAGDGSIITTLPIGTGVDASTFNPATMEAFVSSGDGKLTVIKEKDPKTFEVEQTVQTLQGGKTCTLDAKTGLVYVIANDPSVPVAGAAAPATPPAATPPAPTPPAAAGRGGPGGGGRGRGRGPAGTFTIVVVGKDAK